MASPYFAGSTDAWALEVRGAILDYYGSNSTIWHGISTNTVTNDQIWQAYSNIPTMEVDRAIDGSVLGMSNTISFAVTDSAVENTVQSAGNSNFNTGYYGGGNTAVSTQRVSINTTKDPTTGKYTMTGGAKNSLGQTVATVADKASLAVQGVSLGTKLGLAISDSFYNNTQWYKDLFPNYKPADFRALYGQSETGDFFLRTLFGITSDGQGAYMDERALAYNYMMLREQGAFGDEEIVVPDAEGLDISPVTTPIAVLSASILPITFSWQRGDGTWVDQEVYPEANAEYFLYQPFVSNYSGILRTLYIAGPGKLGNTFTYNGKTVTYHVSTRGFGNSGSLNQRPNGNFQGNYITNGLGSRTDNSFFQNLSWLVYYGNQTVPPVEGITKQPDATIPNPTIVNGTTVQEVLSQLRQNYPSLFDGSITETHLNDDGTTTETNYVPVPMPELETLYDETPTTGELTQEDTATSNQTFTKVNTTTNIKTDPPDTGTGSAPLPVLPTGSASSLWAVYNPSQSELNNFGSWLWSSNFVEQLKKLFNDPMQAIIGVHKVFASPSTSGSATIKCGYLDSGVSAAVVSSQYTSIDCGSVNLNEYFGNVFDYEPYTKVEIYLPFIGVVPLKTSEVMRSKITVIYGVDVITGACLAKVKIERDGSGAILYSYGGSCACHYPISSGSYAGIVSGIVTSAMGVAAGIASGNPLVGAAGVISGVRQMKTDVQHSGGFTGCAGAMGPKTPYLIITRPQTRVANNFEIFSGNKSNAYTRIRECSGFIKVSNCRITSNTAYAIEIAEIKEKLSNGVYYNGGM